MMNWQKRDCPIKMTINPRSNSYMTVTLDIQGDHHEYDVYVFALKDESSAKFIFDAAGEDIDERARRIDEKVDGESGNIISYAMVSGVYTYNVIY